MSDKKRAAFGETLRDEFQVLLKGHITGYLYHNPLSPEDCKEFHILEAEMNQFAETIDELTALAIRLSAVYFAAAPAGCQSKATVSDKEPTPSFYHGHINPGSEVMYRSASRLRHEIPFSAQSVSPSSDRYPESVDPAGTGVGSKARLPSFPAEIHGPITSLPDQFPQFASIAKAAIASEGIGSSHGRQTTHAFTDSRKGQAVPFSPADEDTAPQKDRDGEFLSIEATHAMPAGGPPFAQQIRSVKGLRDLARFVESSQQGGLCMHSERSASHRRQPPSTKRVAWISGPRPEIQKCVGIPNVAVTAGYKASGLKTTHQVTGDGFDGIRHKKTAPVPQTAVSIQQQPELYNAQISNPDTPVLEKPRCRNVFRTHRELHKIRTDIASGARPPLATSVENETGTDRLFVRGGRQWLEKPDGIEDESPDNIMETLVRKIRREYQRFYGD